MRGRIHKILCALNSHQNFHSKYVHMLIFGLSATLESPKFEKSTFRNYVILRNRGIIKLQSRELGHIPNPMSQSNCIYHLSYLRDYALKFQFRKIDFPENPLVTWPKFFDSWLIFHCESDDIVEIPKFKLYPNINFFINKVWIRPFTIIIWYKTENRKSKLAERRLWNLHWSTMH